MDRLVTICLIAMTVFFIVLGSATTNVEGLRARVAALEERVEKLEAEREADRLLHQRQAEAIDANNRFIEARQMGHGFAYSYAKRAGYVAEKEADQ